jgi:hypothetical protein
LPFVCGLEAGEPFDVLVFVGGLGAGDLGLVCGSDVFDGGFDLVCGRV